MDDLTEKAIMRCDRIMAGKGLSGLLAQYVEDMRQEKVQKINLL